GVGVITAAISPYREIRDENRAMVEGDGAVFVEVHAAATVEQCEARDVKGLYAKARAGEIKGFTGIDDPYEEPPAPEVRCETGIDAEANSLEQIIEFLESRGLIGKVQS
ncbi:MAG: adenylyl-sulfate kinase, partial [Chloroflexi bacterium]|nr:adenylyl-sulfate kinase [Chloroflexota bacterium]